MVARAQGAAPNDGGRTHIEMEEGKVSFIVRKLRKEANLTQIQAAARMGVSSSTLARIEKGLIWPDDDMCKRLACALPIDEIWLMSVRDAETGNAYTRQPGRATGLLKALLEGDGGDPKPIHRVMQLAAILHLSPATMRRAAKHLGVIVIEIDGIRHWSLPLIREVPRKLPASLEERQAVYSAEVDQLVSEGHLIKDADAIVGRRYGMPPGSIYAARYRHRVKNRERSEMEKIIEHLEQDRVSFNRHLDSLIEWMRQSDSKMRTDLATVQKTCIDDLFNELRKSVLEPTPTSPRIHHFSQKVPHGQRIAFQALEVQRLVDDGMGVQAAAAVVAQEYGVAVGTVMAARYRARRDNHSAA